MLAAFKKRLENYIRILVGHVCGEMHAYSFALNRIVTSLLSIQRL